MQVEHVPQTRRVKGGLVDQSGVVPPVEVVEHFDELRRRAVAVAAHLTTTDPAAHVDGTLGGSLPGLRRRPCA